MLRFLRLPTLAKVPLVMVAVALLWLFYVHYPDIRNIPYSYYKGYLVNTTKKSPTTAAKPPVAKLIAAPLAFAKTTVAKLLTVPLLPASPIETALVDRASLPRTGSPINRLTTQKEPQNGSWTTVHNATTSRIASTSPRKALHVSPRKVVITAAVAAPVTEPRNPGSRKVILFWTRFFGGPMVHSFDKMSICKVSTCFLTADRSYVNKSSALVFHIRDLSAHDLPSHRNAGQFYVFFLLESPIHTNVNLNSAPWIDFFNLTFSYRWDGDIFCNGYSSMFNPTLWTNRTEFRSLMQQKKNRAVAFISHCSTNSNREAYIAELNNYFPVDIVGGCGVQACPRNVPGCWEKLSVSYKFYLSFENSLCKDYITEKIFLPLNYGVVPVAYGFGNYSEILPPNSFIDTADFRAPRTLALRLWRLALNMELYEKFFEWRFNSSTLRLKRFHDVSQIAACKLCEIIHNTTRKARTVDIHRFWNMDAQCHRRSWSYDAAKDN